MKTLEEIKDEVAREDNYTDWECVGEMGVSDWQVDQIAKRFAIEVAKEALRNAAENSTVTAIQREGFCDYIADTESILSETNIPKL